MKRCTYGILKLSALAVVHGGLRERLPNDVFARVMQDDVIMQAKELSGNKVASRLNDDFEWGMQDDVAMQTKEMSATKVASRLN